MSITTRVRLGTLFLDQMVPGWRSRIDAGRLSIGDPRWCILGQLSNKDVCEIKTPYMTMAEELRLNASQSANLGFTERAADYRALRFANLTRAWRRVIIQMES